MATHVYLTWRARTNRFLNGVGDGLNGLRRSPLARLYAIVPAMNATTLSQRQAQVIELMAKGYGVEKISAQLGISINTVKKRYRAADKKLGPTMPSQAVHSRYCHAASGPGSEAAGAVGREGGSK
jgi:DNA-binding CsgD family transcriptional regulator